MLFLGMDDANTDEVVLTVKQAIPLAKIGRNSFYAILGTRKGPPVKRVGNRFLIPKAAFIRWLTTPTKRKG